MKKFIIILFSAILITQLFSYSLLEREAGNYVENIDTRTAAMGGAAIAGGLRLFDISVNPANLGFLPQKLGVQTSIGILKDNDNRSLPMYNFFDGYVYDAVYASNVNYFDEYSLGIYYRKNISGIGIAAAFLHKPFINFDSYYEEEVRNDENSDYDNYPPIIAKNYFEGDGAINSSGFYAALNFEEIASVGFEISRLFGDSNLKRRIMWTETARNIMVANLEEEDLPAGVSAYDLLPDTTNTLKRDFSDEILFKFGVQTKLSRRISLGFTYSPKIEFDVDIDGSINDVDIDSLFYDYVLDANNVIIDTLYYSDYYQEIYGTYKNPTKFRFGFSYEPRNIMRTYFNCDIEFVNWTDVNAQYDDEINYYIGVEHQLKNKIPLRLGFRYQTTYQKIDDDAFIYSNKISTPTFTAGSGFTFMNYFTLDISAELSKRRYEALDLFMDSYYNDSNYHTATNNYGEPIHFLWQNIQPTDRGWENPDTIDETFIKIQTSISFLW